MAHFGARIMRNPRCSHCPNKSPYEIPQMAGCIGRRRKVLTGLAQLGYSSCQQELFGTKVSIGVNRQKLAVISPDLGERGDSGSRLYISVLVRHQIVARVAIITYARLTKVGNPINVSLPSSTPHRNALELPGYWTTTPKGREDEEGQ